jgi:hypothetical protein
MTDRDMRGDPAGTPGKSGYELSDISSKVAMVFAAGLIVAGVVIHVLVWLLYVYLGQATAASYSRQYPLAAVGAAPLPSAPMLQVKPREELKQLTAEEDALLNGYAWVDRATGIVRIPIDRAMKLVLERGLPIRPVAGETPALLETGPATPTVGQASRLPGDGSSPTQGAASGPVRR